MNMKKISCPVCTSKKITKVSKHGGCICDSCGTIIFNRANKILFRAPDCAVLTLKNGNITPAPGNKFNYVVVNLDDEKEKK